MIKSKDEIEEEIEATKRTLVNYQNAFKQGKIPMETLRSMHTECRATIGALKWVLGKNDRFD